MEGKFVALGVLKYGPLYGSHKTSEHSLVIGGYTSNLRAKSVQHNVVQLADHQGTLAANRRCSRDLKKDAS